MSYRETHLTSRITICCVLCNALLLTLVTTSSSSSNGSALLWQVQISSKTLCCEVLRIFKEPYISGPLTAPESKNCRFWFFEKNIQKSKNHWRFWLFRGLDHSNKPPGEHSSRRCGTNLEKLPLFSSLSLTLHKVSSCC